MRYVLYINAELWVFIKIELDDFLAKFGVSTKELKFSYIQMVGGGTVIQLKLVLHSGQKSCMHQLRNCIGNFH